MRTLAGVLANIVTHAHIDEMVFDYVVKHVLIVYIRHFTIFCRQRLCDWRYEEYIYIKEVEEDDGGGEGGGGEVLVVRYTDLKLK